MNHWTQREEEDVAPKGLPAPLPAGERILWQGSPPLRPFLRRIFHTHLVVVYVGVLLGWALVAGAQAGNLPGAAWAALIFALLAGGALGLLGAVGWALARSTTYTITTARVVLEFGAAFEKTLQIPFTKIAAADVAAHADGTADIVLRLNKGNKIAYLLLWPYARPWHFSQPQPSLRAVPDGVAVAQLLGRALAAHAGQPAQAVADAPAASTQGPVAAAA